MYREIHQAKIKTRPGGWAADQAQVPQCQVPDVTPAHTSRCVRGKNQPPGIAMLHTQAVTWGPNPGPLEKIWWIQKLFAQSKQISIDLQPRISLKLWDNCVQEEWQVLPSASNHMQHLWVCIKMHELEFRETPGNQEPFPNLSAPQEWTIWQIPSIVWAQGNVAEVSLPQNANTILGTAESTASCWHLTHPLGSGIDAASQTLQISASCLGMDTPDTSLELQLLTAEQTKSHFFFFLKYPTVLHLGRFSLCSEEIWGKKSKKKESQHGHWYSSFLLFTVIGNSDF